MKKLQIILLALAIPVFATAQNEPSKAEMKDKSEKRVENKANAQTNWMKANLELNEDQLEDVTEINHKYVEKREEVFMEKESKESKWEELEENWNEQLSELKDVLSEEQYTKLESVKGQWYDAMKNRWAKNDRHEMDDNMLEATDRTEDDIDNKER